MKRSILFIASMLAIGGSFSVNAAHQAYLAQRPSWLPAVQRFVKHVAAKRHWGVIIARAHGKVLYQYRPNASFVPASTQKLLTAVAAVQTLGKDFRFRTTVWQSGVVEKGVLHGDLSMRFMGDPSLTHADLQQLLRHAIQRAGIRQIQGHINLDISWQNGPAYAPGWMWDELSYGYAAPMSAMVIDENKFHLALLPNAQSKRPRLQTNLPGKVATFHNQVRLTARRVKQCPLVVYSSANNDYHLSGCVPRLRSGYRSSLAIRQPSRYARALLRATLKQLKVTVQHGIRVHARTVSARRVAVHVSAPLSVLVRHCLKDSDNMIANALSFAVAAKRLGSPVSWQRAEKAMQAVLQPIVRHDISQWHWVDAAGLSRYNMLTPAMLDHTLRYIDAHPALRTVILPALPVWGRDGTLAGRLQHMDLRNQIHAKTGTMTGVSALAGWLRDQNHTYRITLLMNGSPEKAKANHRLEATLLTRIMRG